MDVSTAVDVKRAALPRYDPPSVADRKPRSPYDPAGSRNVPDVVSNLPVLVSAVAVPALRSGADVSVVVPGDRGATRIVDASVRRGETYGPRTERWQADFSEVHDRVTISPEAYAKTAPRRISYDTYDKRGNLSPIVQSPVSTGAAAYAGTIRDQVTLVLKPPSGAVRRGVGAASEPAQILVWFSPNTVPEPA